MTLKLFNLILFVLLINLSNAQYDTRFSISNSTQISTERQPLWLWANRDGKIDQDNRFLNLSDIYFFGKNYGKDSSSFLLVATDLVAGFGNKTQYLQANELFAGINLKNWEIKAGLWVNEMQLGGLSTSNGNLALSRNARPHPRINVRIADYKPVPWIGKYVLFKGEFEEGWLNDKRFVDDTHLHHKSFYLKFRINEKLDFEGGIEHFVMWGGKSSNDQIGYLPDSFHAYIKYITGQSGDDEFLMTDQLNVAGNQYGTYQARITYRFAKWDLILNLSHPYDDYSGVNWRNKTDNLTSIYLSSTNKNRLITDFIYEFTDTRNQSARSDSLYFWDDKNQQWRKNEYDNYFNHGIYRSGATYHQMSMVSPLFYPVIIQNQISQGFESTRFLAHHFGAKGKLSPNLSWKGMATFIQHMGTYQKPYPDKLSQLSVYFQLFYKSNNLPVDLGVELASDKIKYQNDNFGLQITVSKHL